jgi:protein-export membrane protein SecD
VLHFERWKIIAISLSVLIAALLCVPNLLPTAQQDVLKGYGLRPMTLGLDLQGGSNVLLEVDRKDLTDQLKQQLSGDMRSTLREQRIAYSNLQRTPTGVSVKVSKPEDLEKAKSALNLLLQPQQGGLLAGGVPTNLFALETLTDGFALNIVEQGLENRVATAVQQSIRIIENRVNALGTTEPVIQQQGVDRIVVQLPGVQDPERVKDIIGKTAKLSFQLLCEDQPGGASQLPPPDCRSHPLKEGVDAAIKAKRDKGDKSELTAKELEELPQLWVQFSSRATVDGADLNDAQPSFDQQNNPVVSFRFNQKGAVKFGKLTAENVNKPFAIILDNIIQSYPTINEPILGGSGQISGNFSVAETSNLAIVLRSGALPAKLTIVEERTVGPSLGADSVRAGFVACAIGLVGVMAFMFLPYGFFGFVANLALLANLLLLIASMSFFGFTLTLPGIAGILLTLGMAVDSNVLIYERIREEWRNGRTALSSIEVGFKSALGTVLDANITTLIAAVVLFGVGSGPVRGFAITLAIGIFTTMFTAFTVTRMIVALWVKRNRPKEINL